MIRGLLAVVVAAELVALGVRWQRVPSESPSRPPLISPDLALYVDPITASAIESLQENSEADTPEAWRELGRALAVFGMFGEAELCFVRAAQLSPGEFLDHFWLGMILDRQGRPEEAIEQFELAAPQARGASRAGHDYRELCWHMIGREHLRLKDVQAAEAAFRKAPGLLAARYELAKALVRNEREDAAIEMLDKLVAEHPQRHQLYILRARARWQRGELEPMEDDIDMLERADKPIRTDLVSQTLGDLESDYPLAEALSEASQAAAAGQTEYAATVAKNILRRHWRSEFAEHVIVDRLKRGDVDGAKRLVAKTMQRDGPVPFDVIRIGDLFLQAGDLVQAWDLYDQSLYVVSNAPGHMRLSALFKRGEDQKNHIKHLARAKHVEAETAFRNNDLESARSGLHEALKINPDQAISWYYLGECERLLGNADRARDAYEKCLNADATYGRALRGLRRLEGKTTILPAPAP